MWSECRFGTHLNLFIISFYEPFILASCNMSVTQNFFLLKKNSLHACHSSSLVHRNRFWFRPFQPAKFDLANRVSHGHRLLAATDFESGGNSVNGYSGIHRIHWRLSTGDYPRFYSKLWNSKQWWNRLQPCEKKRQRFSFKTDLSWRCHSKNALHSSLKCRFLQDAFTVKASPWWSYEFKKPKLRCRQFCESTIMIQQLWSTRELE